jgi:hypothetical protein
MVQEHQTEIKQNMHFDLKPKMNSKWDMDVNSKSENL